MERRLTADEPISEWLHALASTGANPGGGAAAALMAGMAAALVEMEAEVRNLAREHRRARALAALGIGPRPEDRVAVDDRRGLHPGAMLTARSLEAGKIGRAGLEHADAMPRRTPTTAEIVLRGEEERVLQATATPLRDAAE